MLNPTEFLESYTGIGEKKAAARFTKLFLLAILAGFMIATGGAVTTMATFDLAGGPSAAKIVSGLLFPMGLVMVILTGAELFTGNCLITIPLLERRVGIRGMLRNLVVVYLGNFVGALLLALAIVGSGGASQPTALTQKIIQVAAAKCALPFGRALVLGILCNLLVCIAVMCALCGKSLTERAIGAIAPITCFVICGFEHCVANMYYIPAGLFSLSIPQHAQLMAELGIDVSSLTWGAFLLHNLLPVTLGNLIGGCGFAALLWAAHRKT